MQYLIQTCPANLVCDPVWTTMDYFEDIASMHDLLESPNFECERTTLVRVVDHIIQFEGIYDGDRFISDSALLDKFPWDASTECQEVSGRFQKKYRECKNASWMAWTLCPCIPKRELVGVALECLLLASTSTSHTMSEREVWRLLREWMKGKLTTEELKNIVQDHQLIGYLPQTGLYQLYSFITRDVSLQSEIAEAFSMIASFYCERILCVFYDTNEYTIQYDLLQKQFADIFRQTINFRDVVEAMLASCT